jgi:hypothetical protein
MGKKAYTATGKIQKAPYRAGAYVLGKDRSNEPRILSMDEDDRLNIGQMDLYAVFNDMLTELKKINLQLSLMTDVELTNEVE